MRTLLVCILTIVTLSACGKSSDTTAETGPCKDFKFIGTWKNVTSPTETWKFKADCTVEISKCGKSYGYTSTGEGAGTILSTISVDSSSCTDQSQAPLECSVSGYQAGTPGDRNNAPLFYFTCGSTMATLYQ